MSWRSVSPVDFFGFHSMIAPSFFFFSSRRRHTRWTGDWSSDVCSSDLALILANVLAIFLNVGRLRRRAGTATGLGPRAGGEQAGNGKSQKASSNNRINLHVGFSFEAGSNFLQSIEPHEAGKVVEYSTRLCDENAKPSQCIENTGVTWTVRSVRRLSPLLELLLFEGFGGRVEDSVEEGRGFRRGEFLGKLDGFVDNDFHGRCAGAEFVDCQAQDSAIYFGHPFNAPVFRQPLDKFVTRSSLRDRAFKKFVREFAGAHRSARGFPE